MPGPAVEGRPLRVLMPQAAALVDELRGMFGREAIDEVMRQMRRGRPVCCLVEVCPDGEVRERGMPPSGWHGAWLAEARAWASGQARVAGPAVAGGPGRVPHPGASGGSFPATPTAGDSSRRRAAVAGPLQGGCTVHQGGGHG